MKNLEMPSKTNQTNNILCPQFDWNFLNEVF
jgi:hypothetical protein